MHFLFVFLTFLTVLSQICPGISQTITAIPMVIQLPSPLVVQADIAGTSGGLTTYLLHDPPNANSDDNFTIGGTITYVLGPQTASVRMVDSDDDGNGGTTTVTADAGCSLTGTKPGDVATCTLTGTDIETTTLPVTLLTITIGAVSTGAPSPTQSGSNSASITPSPGSSPVSIPKSTGATTGNTTASPTATHPSAASQNSISRFIPLITVLMAIMLIV